MTESEPSKLTPMMRQFHDIKKDHPDKILFFRLGDFYEMFEEDAVVASRILQITLTKRHDIPMCGIPFHAAQNYLSKLLTAGKVVAIVEQTKDPDNKGLFKRAVAQIVSPGTISELSHLGSGDFHYLAAFQFEKGKKDQGAFAILEATTGDLHFFPYRESNGDVWAWIESLLARFNPKEILIPESLSLPEVFSFEKGVKTFLPSFIFTAEHAERKLLDFYSEASLKLCGLLDERKSLGLVYALLSYLKDNQKSPLHHLKLPVRQGREGKLWVDKVTLRNLELLHNTYDQTESHSLYSALRSTKTAMGARKLRETIIEPWSDLALIESRLDQVSFLLTQAVKLSQLREALSAVGDFERLCSRIGSGRVLPRELVSFNHSLERAVNVFELLLGDVLLVGGVEDEHLTRVTEMISLIKKSLLEEPNNTLSEGGYLKPEIDAKLHEFSKALSESSQWVLDLLAEEQKANDLNALKVKYTEANGYFFELSKLQSKNAPAHFIKKQTLVSGDRYTTEKLLQIETAVEEAKSHRVELEQQLFRELIAALQKNIASVQAIGEKIAELDLLASFAHQAQTRNYVRPKLTKRGGLTITAGRHPVVEAAAVGSFSFVPNDLAMGDKEGRIHLITGPNMSGKSTFLKQSALIVHMAHMGSFVPASKAEIPLTDRIFTRIGASDQLARGESTFMVEMNETAQILTQATANSLILMDEIGRGTSTYDGLSLAWSILEFLVKPGNLGAKTFFATHYHELTKLDSFPEIKNFHLSVREENGELHFLRRIVSGPADDSYGIQVARLAGVPEAVTERAKEILNDLENGRVDHAVRETKTEKKVSETWLEKELKKINPSEVTPMEALAILDEWKKKLG
jgi:DNA mismatch repair protein MutS